MQHVWSKLISVFYFSSFNPNQTIGKMEPNGIILYIMPTVWGKHDVIQGFDYEEVPFNNDINRF